MYNNLSFIINYFLMAFPNFREISTSPHLAPPDSWALLSPDQSIYYNTIFSEINNFFRNESDDKIRDFQKCLHIIYLDNGDVEVIFEMADIKLSATIPNIRLALPFKADLDSYTLGNLSILRNFIQFTWESFLRYRRDEKLSTIVGQISEVLSWRDDELPENV